MDNPEMSMEMSHPIGCLEEQKSFIKETAKVAESLKGVTRPEDAREFASGLVLTRFAGNCFMGCKNKGTQFNKNYISIWFGQKLH